MPQKAPEILFFDEVESTNDAAFELAQKGSPHGTVIAAESQRRGRGRLGRVWHSPRGKNIYMSMILSPRLRTEEMPLLTPLTAVSAVNAIRKITGVNVVLKWPNDLMAAGRKLGGILLEMRQNLQKTPIIVAGIGINVNMEAGDFSPSLGATELNATSLLIETGHKHEKTPIIEAISGEVLLRLDQFEKNGLLNEWRGLLDTLGKEVTAHTPNETITGLALDINEDGSLLIKTPEGEIKTVRSGDVQFKRQIDNKTIHLYNTCK